MARANRHTADRSPGGTPRSRSQARGRTRCVCTLPPGQTAARGARARRVSRRADPTFSRTASVAVGPRARTWGGQTFAGQESGLGESRVRAGSGCTRVLGVAASPLPAGGGLRLTTCGQTPEAQLAVGAGWGTRSAAAASPRRRDRARPEPVVLRGERRKGRGAGPGGGAGEESDRPKSRSARLLQGFCCARNWVHKPSHACLPSHRLL